MSITQSQELYDNLHQAGVPVSLVTVDDVHTFQTPEASLRVALETRMFFRRQRFGKNIGGLLWDRFTVHYTPKHGSWFNQAEIEISLLSRQCLGRRRIASPPELQQETQAWNRKMNRERVTINWQFTRSKARRKFGYKRNQIIRSET